MKGVNLWGFAGSTETVHSVAELKALFDLHPAIAGHVYVYMWMPILRNTPWFPIAIVATDNEFDAEYCFAKWRLMHKNCSRCNLSFAGHVSDGDSRMRKLDFRVNFEKNSSDERALWSSRCAWKWQHILLLSSIPCNVEGQ
jgi:hypothetical protein